MKKIVLLIWLFVCSNGFAFAFHFNDSNVVWPGWEQNNNIQDDVYGVPDILGGYINVNNGYLNEIVIEVDKWNINNALYSSLSLGDIFIDLGGNYQWDYVLSFWDYSNKPTFHDNVMYSLFPYERTGTLYKLDEPLISTTSYKNNFGYLNNSPYYLSNYTNTYGFPRYNQPVALNPNYFDNIDVIDNYGLLSGWTTTTWLISDLMIDLSNYNDIILGLTVSCANDMLFERISVNSPNPVPEPSTLALLLIGSSVMFIKYRKKRF